MLKFVLIEETETRVLYAYYPEGSFESGTISFDKTARKGAIETLADPDKHQIYAMKALKRIHEMATQQSFEKEGLIEETAVSGRKRTYAITRKGLDAYHEELDRLRACILDAETQDDAFLAEPAPCQLPGDAIPAPSL